MTEAISMNQILKELKFIEENMATKKDVKELAETIEIMSHPETMMQVAESSEDIKYGKVKTVNSAQELLSEM